MDISKESPGRYFVNDQLDFVVVESFIDNKIVKNSFLQVKLPDGKTINIKIEDSHLDALDYAIGQLY